MAGLLALSVAWVFGNTPFGSPDETQHYLRAIGVGEGHVIGRKVPYAARGLTRAQLAWVEQASREVHVPNRLGPSNSDCAAQHADASAACTAHVVLTPAADVPVQVGNYQPLPYVLPGVAILRATSPVSALFAGRVASLLATLPFLLGGVAALTLRRRSAAAAVGVGLAVTPMVLYVMASVNPSGMEIAAGFAFVAFGFRLAEQPSRLTWAAVGVTGFVLGISRSPGAVWVVALSALVVLWHGPKRAVGLVADWKLPASFTAGALTLGVVLNRSWEALYGSHIQSVTPGAAEAVHTARALLPIMTREAIGVFGYLNVSLPSVAYGLWEVMLVGVSVAAVVLSSRYRRLVIIAATLALIALPAIQYFYVTTTTGYPVQARHLLPVFVVFPIIAAEGLRRSSSEWAPALSRWSALLLIPIAGLNAVAWWTNARRAAVGRGGARAFFLSASWHPPLGWYPWVILAALGAALIALSGFVYFAAEGPRGLGAVDPSS
ncbi:MAG: DUF2142 domain-containing protein [Actinobacteria bacterium]|nr:DUF2142 domain-containing protein [Actinomycetota bacterium]